MSDSDDGNNMSPLELVLLAPENVSILGPVERWELAVDENTPAAVLRLLCLEDTGGQLSHEIANNPNSPDDAIKLANIRLLSSDERGSIARSAKLYILAGLARDNDREVRTEVAGNPRTPVSAFTVLTSDKEQSVRIKVAWNYKTPPSVLSKLANDEDKYVRAAVAENPNTSPETITKLTNDKNKQVREAAESHYKNCMKC